MLFDTIIETLDEHRFDPQKDSLVAGISGGIDSMVLLSVLHKLNYNVIVVHVNYHKRGEASDKDQELVVKTSRKYGYDCIVHSVFPDQVTGNFQKWARKERYDKFEKVRTQYNARAIAVAHHLNDQIETILQKIMRGAGIESWKGMPVLEENVLRPMLSVSREEITEFAKLHDIPFRNDASNFESDFARNFLRNEWIPHMDQLLPGWQTNIARIPVKANLFDESLRFIAKDLQKPQKRIDRNKLLSLSEDLQKAVINFMVKEYYGEKKTMTASSLENAINIEHLQTGAGLELGKNLKLIRDRDTFVFKLSGKDTSEKEKEITFDELNERAINFEGLHITYNDCPKKNYREGTLYINLKRNDWPVKIRKWHEGDRFQPLGMQGHKKISDLLTDKKIDASVKNEALVVVSFEETICAVIFPQFKNFELGSISEQYKCFDTTNKALIIKKQI